MAKIWSTWFGLSRALEVISGAFPEASREFQRATGISGHVSGVLSGIAGGISGGFKESCGRCQKRFKGVSRSFGGSKGHRSASGVLIGVLWGIKKFRGAFKMLQRV